MTGAAWMSFEALGRKVHNLFPPFAASLELLEADALNLKGASAFGGRGDTSENGTSENYSQNSHKPLTSGTPLNRMKVADSPFNSDEDKEWITVNGARVKLENGELQGEVGEKITEAPVKLLATGANPSIPDMTSVAQKRHKKHLLPGKSFPGMSINEYVKNGSELARQPVGGSIEGYRGEDGCVVRFNNSTGEWVKAYDTGVASYMKPTLGRVYYEKWLKNDKGVTSDE